MIVIETPAIVSLGRTTFVTGSAGSFTVRTTGFPTPYIFASAVRLPAGVTFTNNGDGTATLSGTPAIGTYGSYSLTLTPSSLSVLGRSQLFTLTVIQSPAFTSSTSTVLTAGTAGTFTVTTSGSPAPTISQTGTLPAGVTFTDNGNGTATLSGTPAIGAAGSYPLALTASNSAGVTQQAFTLTVESSVAAVPLPTKPPLPQGLLYGVLLKTRVGQVLTVTGSGFTPGAPIEIGWYLPRTVLTHTTANSAGKFSTTVTIPNVRGIKAIMAAGVGTNGKARYLAAPTLVR